MKLAIDVYYYENHAKAVGVLFNNWEAEKEEQIIISYIKEILPYESGSFYKRELPCIIELLQQINLNDIDEIIIDGYVFLDDNEKPGLGYYLYEYLKQEKIIIGVAKTSFHNNYKYVKELYRGESKKPLFLTAIGVSLEQAEIYIKSMYGNFRIPKLLKLLDQKTKEEIK